MKVKVTQLGFMKKLRYPGELMDVPENQFSKTWMESLEPKDQTPEAEEAFAPAGPASSQEAPKRPVGRPKKTS